MTPQPVSLPSTLPAVLAGARTRVRFTFADSALGQVLVAATDQGLCAILIGDDPQMLLRDLRRRFPRAEIHEADAAFGPVAERVARFVEAPRSELGLALDLRGTVFQQRVWEALREIPAGCTASYSDIAHRIGAPKAVRAVAQACGANPLAVVVPCHRVVRRDGDLCGYRWGLERKRALLDREAIGAGPA